MIREKSITLLELVVSMVLLGMIILGATAFDSVSHSFFADARHKARVTNELSLILGHIGKYAEQATGNRDDQGIYTSQPPAPAPSSPCGAGNVCLYLRNDNGTMVWRKYEYTAASHALVFTPDIANPVPENLSRNVAAFQIGPPMIGAEPQINGIAIQDLRVRFTPGSPASPGNPEASLDANGDNVIDADEIISFYSYSHSTN